MHLSNEDYLKTDTGTPVLKYAIDVKNNRRVLVVHSIKPYFVFSYIILVNENIDLIYEKLFRV